MPRGLHVILRLCFGVRDLQADLNWHAPWSGETPLDAARGTHQRAVIAWLTESGAASE